jgi:hypothetical protein
MLADREKEKARVNLGIDKNVLERAKAAGINISAATEGLLKALTYSPRGNTVEDVIQAQERLLHSIQQVLKKYNATLEVGRITEGEEGLLDYYGGKIVLVRSLLLVENPVKDIATPLPISKIWEYLYPTEKIIESLILTLIEASEKNREKVRQLEFALRFVKALSIENGDLGQHTARNEAQDKSGK